MYFYTFTYEQITADLSSKTVLTARRGDKYINHDIPDEDIKYRQKFERSKTSGHNSWVQSQRHTRFTNTVQYLVQACRPTRELTTEHELVRSVVPSTSVSWCVWHIDHARHTWNLTRVSQVASQTVTLHAQDTFTVLHYHYMYKIYVQHTSSNIINPVLNDYWSYEPYSLINVMNDFSSHNVHSEAR